MGRRIVVMKLIFSRSHFECGGHTVHKLSQQGLTADLLAPWESDCSRMRNKVFSDWLPSYIKQRDRFSRISQQQQATNINIKIIAAVTTTATSTSTSELLPPSAVAVISICQCNIISNCRSHKALYNVIWLPKIQPKLLPVHVMEIYMEKF